MFKYVLDVSSLSHYIVKNFCNKFDFAVDATLGNGYDTDFLCSYFSKVYSFDIQSDAVNAYRSKEKNNVLLINDSHENFNEYISENIDCIMYNLGFLPGGDKNITTTWQSTLKSLECGLKILENGGIITLALYRGHEEGKKEEKAILNFVENLPKNKYGVLLHSFLNRDNNPPLLIVIEKK
ncbi:class I SAM-dependent methyltransferase [Clostridium sp. DJ247]|uniref:tRNA (mnm(5)s(2)U34)-methyltransferase n=1 Tax=Clostridium sp. DJ247 TaxID=2726188 RepID=UPI0016232BB6|nr:class I SAM-dependent methyltransferase [Clostridium sp. DJ247]MBC2581352.1 rRNA methylase [Clostridium sp. DJ247]